LARGPTRPDPRRARVGPEFWWSGPAPIGSRAKEGALARPGPTRGRPGPTLFYVSLTIDLFLELYYVSQRVFTRLQLLSTILKPFHTFPTTVNHFSHPTGSSFTHSHPFSNIFDHFSTVFDFFAHIFHLLSTTFNHLRVLSYIFIQFQPFSLTFNHFLSHLSFLTTF
jgi:hypothetical protein